MDASPEHCKAERAKAKKLRQSAWWLEKLSRGECHYCQEKFPRKELTMDHVVPLIRGGQSTRGNIVPSCRPCNQKKTFLTPAELLLTLV